MNKPVVTTRLSSKGQIVLPKAVRDAHGWKAGTQLEVIERGGEVMLRLATRIDERFPPITPEEFLKLRIKVNRPYPTDKEIEETLLKEAARRFDATRS